LVCHLGATCLYTYSPNCLFSLQVLVMTAQILLNILRHSIIKMEAINLLILDECHHAVKKHPYSLVMSEFYHTTPKDKRPTVFGMTASPVNLKGNCDNKVLVCYYFSLFKLLIILEEASYESSFVGSHNFLFLA
jgi:superfamily II DNA or RNA helicase